MLYIITTESFPYGLAATQRIKCYAKSIVELGEKCCVLCINRCEDQQNPLGNTATEGTVDGYDYRYMGSTTIRDGRSIVRLLYQGLDFFKLLIIILRSFKSSDKVIIYTYNGSILRLVRKLSKIKKFELFYEINEHPVVHKGVFNVNGDSLKDMEKIKKIIDGLTGIICISATLKNFFVRVGIPDEKIHIVNMLVDASRFEGIEKQEIEPYIGYCGAADNNKDGVDKLIKAFSLIVPNHPDLKLYIMGPKNASSKNEELANNLGIGDRVFFTGMVSPDIMPQMLVNAQALALARPQSIQAQYGFPTKLGEYLLTGNPVVATAVGDIPVFLKNEENAYLAEPDDIEDIAMQLDKAMSDENAANVGARGREIAKTFFSGDMVKKQLENALNLK